MIKACLYLGDAVVHPGLAVVSVGFGLSGRLLVLGSSLLESLQHVFGGRGSRGGWQEGGSWVWGRRRWHCIFSALTADIHVASALNVQHSQEKISTEPRLSL